MEKLLTVDYINLEVTDYYVCKVNLYNTAKKCHVSIRTYGTLNLYRTLPYGTVQYHTGTVPVPYRTVPYLLFRL